METICMGIIEYNDYYQICYLGIVTNAKERNGLFSGVRLAIAVKHGALSEHAKKEE